MPLEILLGLLLGLPIWDSYSESLLGVHESTALLFSGEALGRCVTLISFAVVLL
jgi:cell shape-determining protein MreD